MISNIGIISQTPEAVPAAKDALRFDRDYQDGVILGTSFVTGARTISFWLKPFYTSFVGMSREFLMAQYGNSGQRTFYMEINANGVLNAFFSTTTTGNNFGQIQSNAGQFFDSNQWYYITFTIETSGGTKLYVDGVQQTITHPNTLQLSRTGGTFCWGRFRPTSTTLIGSSIQKELTIWTTERTPSEVVADMTRVYTGSESGLKAYFPTNEGSGNIVQDINLVYTGSIQTFNTTPNYINDTMWVVS